MLNVLSNLFSSRTGATTAPFDAHHIAIATLMVRIAKMDDTYCDAEAAVVMSQIETQIGLPTDAAQQLANAATTEEALGKDTVTYTQAIKAAVVLDDRTDIIQALWAVALADGARDVDENSEMRLIAKLLGISDRASAFARQRASDLSS